MEKRKFGRTGWDVSPIGFGGGAVSGEGGGYGFGAISESDAISLVQEALDSGINLLDTAPIYGFGLSEKRIGKAIKGRRDDAIVVSKSGVSWHDNMRVNMTNDPKVTQAMLEQSLRDLATDYIDLYMIHWPDQNVDIRKPMEVLAAAREQGKIRAIGLCNTYKEDLERAEEIAPIDVAQSEYNLFSNGVEDYLFPHLKERGVGFMSWGTLDKGILTGRVNKDRKFDEHDSRSKAPWWKNADHSWKYRTMERVKPLLDEHGHTGLEMALGFVLRLPYTSVALCGTRNSEQIQTSIKAVSHLPSDELLDKCIAIAAEERP